MFKLVQSYSFLSASLEEKKPIGSMSLSKMTVRPMIAPMISRERRETATASRSLLRIGSCADLRLEPSNPVHELLLHFRELLGLVKSCKLEFIDSFVEFSGPIKQFYFFRVFRSSAADAFARRAPHDVRLVLGHAPSLSLQVLKDVHYVSLVVLSSSCHDLESCALAFGFSPPFLRFPL